MRLCLASANQGSSSEPARARDDPAKVGDEALGGGNRHALLAERLAVGAFMGVEIRDGAEEEPMRQAGRELALVCGRIGRVIAPSTPTRTA